MSVKSFYVKRQDPININISAKIDFNCDIKEIRQLCTAYVEGGYPPYTYEWRYSDEPTPRGFAERFAANKTGMLILQVTDFLGCIQSYSFFTSVPKLGFNYNLLDCNTHAYRFEPEIINDEVGNYSYYWEFGDGNSSHGKNPQHTYLQPGNYLVKLTISGYSCNTTFEEIIVVESRPELSLDKEALFCKGDSVLVQVSGAAEYLWSNGSTGNTMMIKRPGSYYVMGTSASGCTSVYHFKASYYENNEYIIYTDKDKLTSENSTINIWSQDIPMTNYSWDFGDGNQDYGNFKNHEYEVNHDGYFDIKLNTINPHGCHETATKRIWVVAELGPNTFTPNGDGKNDIFMKGWHIQVYNRNGILLFEGNQGWDGTFNGRPVSNDTYFYVLMYMSSEGTKTKPGFVTLTR